MNVGFYYMANACGRLAGTVLSGVVYQRFGLVGCLWASAAIAATAGLVSLEDGGRVPAGSIVARDKPSA